MDVNILLTAVGRRDYLIDYFKNIDEYNCRLIVANSVQDTTAMWKADKAYLTSPIKSNQYLPELLEICKKENIHFVISLFDLDTLFLAKHRSDFSALGVHLIVSDAEVVETCLDKWKMMGFLNAHNIKTPKVYRDIKTVVDLIEKEQLNFPLVLKPQWGQGSMATEVVYNMKELLGAYEFLSSKVQRTSISHVEFLDYENQLLIQEFISGEEYGVDCINDLKGCHQANIVKRKSAMRAGETDGAITVKNELISKVAADLAGNLRHISIIDIDIIMNGNDAFIIDINPRFGGGYPFSHSAGANLPKAILQWFFEGKCDASLLEYEFGVLSLKGIRMAAKAKP